MYRDIAKLVLYRDLGEDSILMKLSGIFEDFDLKRCENAELLSLIHIYIPYVLRLSAVTNTTLYPSNMPVYSSV